MPLAKILLATDGSPEAASTARMAITFSRSLDGELYSTSCAYSTPNDTDLTQGLSTWRVGRLTSSAPSVDSTPFCTNTRGDYGQNRAWREPLPRTGRDPP